MLFSLARWIGMSPSLEAANTKQMELGSPELRWCPSTPVPLQLCHGDPNGECLSSSPSAVGSAVGDNTSRSREATSGTTCPSRIIFLFLCLGFSGTLPQGVKKRPFITCRQHQATAVMPCLHQLLGQARAGVGDSHSGEDRLLPTPAMKELG